MKNHFWKLILPITFQQFMLALVSASDVLMLGGLNQDSLSAVSLTGQIAFVFNLFMAALAAFVFQAPVIVVYFLLNLDEVVKLPAVYRHYKKYRWVRNLTKE